MDRPDRDPRMKSVDAVDWVESMRISETRNYVQRVIENVQVYRNRLGDIRRTGLRALSSRAKCHIGPRSNCRWAS
jgi:hypothetical protein